MVHARFVEVQLFRDMYFCVDNPCLLTKLRIELKKIIEKHYFLDFLHVSLENSKIGNFMFFPNFVNFSLKSVKFNEDLGIEYCYEVA